VNRYSWEAEVPSGSEAGGCHSLRDWRKEGKQASCHLASLSWTPDQTKTNNKYCLIIFEQDYSVWRHVHRYSWEAEAPSGSEAGGCRSLNWLSDWSKEGKQAAAASLRRARLGCPAPPCAVRPPRRPPVVKGDLRQTGKSITLLPACPGLVYVPYCKKI
jgi:hypothetical protein